MTSRVVTCPLAGSPEDGSGSSVAVAIIECVTLCLGIIDCVGLLIYYLPAWSLLV